MFNLERAIGEWKRSMRKKRAILDGDLVELESYLRDKVEDLVSHGTNEEDAFHKAESEFLRASGLDSDYYRARSPKSGSRPPWQAPRFMPALLWNFMKVSLRRIKRQLGYSLINILSLAVGLACFILFFMSWTYERSYDRSVKDASRIYRLDQKTASGEIKASRGMYKFLAPVLKKAVPEVEETTQFNVIGQGLFRYGERSFKQHANFFLAEPSVFRLLSLPVVKGDPDRILEAPDSIALSETMAKKLFGDDEPMGKTVQLLLFQFDDKNRTMDFQVRGVFKDQPSAASYRFEVLIPFRVKDRFDSGAGPTRENWEYSAPTFLKVREGVEAGELEQKIRTLAISTAGLTTSEKARSSPYNSLVLTRLTDIHFSDDRDARRYLAVFAAISLAVLSLAVINFVNLSTALAVKRIREIGVRKIAGAGRGILVRQFLGESVLLAFLALGLAMTAVMLSMPLFETAAGRAVELSELWGGGFILELLGIAAAAGILAGLYPAIQLSRIKPVRLFALSRTSRTSRSLLRKGLVFAQFALLGILMTGTWMVVRQMGFIERSDRGLNLDKIILINMYDQSIYTNREARLNRLKAELQASPSIAGVTNPWGVPPRIDIECKVRPEGGDSANPLVWKWMSADADFLPVFSIPLAAGSNFASTSRGAAFGSVLINESAAKLLGPGSPLGRRLGVEIYSYKADMRIVGIVKDFHGRSLHHRIDPLVIQYNPACHGVLSVKVSGADRGKGLAAVEAAWKSVFPATPLEYTFIDDFVKESYSSEEHMSRLGRVFSVLAVFVACAGLFGLVSQSTKQRRKEMGVRKVLGASLGHINWMFVKEFARPVLLSNLVAWPVAFYWGQRWLQGFAYRAGLSWGIFLLTSVLAVAASLATVGFQVFRASAENPVETLRYE